MRWLTAIVLGLWLSACGGDGDKEPRTITFLGDSLMTGEIAIPPYQLEVSPVQRIAQIKGIRAIDRTASGALVSGYLSGRIPAMPLKGDVVIRLGGADALLGVPPDVFRRELIQLVEQVDGRVWLVGLIQTDSHPVEAATFDAIVKEVAEYTGTPFIDTRAEPKGALIDGIHPDQAYSDAMAEKIASEV